MQIIWVPYVYHATKANIPQNAGYFANEDGWHIYLSEPGKFPTDLSAPKSFAVFPFNSFFDVHGMFLRYRVVRPLRVVALPPGQMVDRKLQKFLQRSSGVDGVFGNDWDQYDLCLSSPKNVLADMTMLKNTAA